MASAPVRMTLQVRLVLDALAHARHDQPLWGYRLCELTGLGSGTIYPIMERLETGKYVSAHVETPRPTDRPPRRFYELTGAGRELAASAARTATGTSAFQVLRAAGGDAR